MALIHCHFHSQALGVDASVDVLLPERPGRPRRYPVLYLLHGLSDDHTIWQRRTAIERYVAPLDLAVVMPAVNRSFYADMAHGARYWSFVSAELPAVARRLFPLSPRREDTYVAGLSMGGYGAFRLALRLPGRFAAAASLSGVLDIAAVAQLPEGEPFRAELADVFGDLARLPGSEHDLFHLAAELARRGGPRPRLYQCCGTEDFLYQDNRRFRRHAVRLGLDLTYEQGPAQHEWGYWDRQIRRVLQWMGFEPGA